MQINSPVKQSVIEDWDITLIGGVPIGISLDRELGDTCDFPSTHPIIHFHRVARPSAVNQSETIPAEDFYIPVANVLGIRKQDRIVEPLSIEEQEEWQLAMEELTGRTKPQLTH